MALANNESIKNYKHVHINTILCCHTNQRNDKVNMEYRLWFLYFIPIVSKLKRLNSNKRTYPTNPIEVWNRFTDVTHTHTQNAFNKILFIRPHLNIEERNMSVFWIIITPERCMTVHSFAAFLFSFRFDIDVVCKIQEIQHSQTPKIVCEWAMPSWLLVQKKKKKLVLQQ